MKQPDNKGRNSVCYSGLFSAHAPPAFIITALLFYCYGDTFHYPFQFDDNFGFIVGNHAIRNIADIKSIWSFNPARFLVFFSLAVNYYFGELNTFGYHVFNFAVHFINTLLVYWLASLLLSACKQFKLPGFEAISAVASLFPLFVALLFAVHPLQTESVTYIWQRNTSMSAMFYLLSMACYLKSSLFMEEYGDKGKFLSNLFLAVSIISAVSAMFTKQISITLPIAIVLLDYCFVSGSFARIRARASRLAWFIPTFYIIPLLTAFGWDREITHLGARQNNILSHHDYLLTQFNVIVTYLRLLVFPVNQNLDYDYPPAHSIFDCWQSLTLLLLVAAFGVWSFKRNRIVSFGIFFFFLALSVESSILPLEDLIFEHRVYLPSAGFFMAVVATLFFLIENLLRWNSKMVVTTTLIVIVIPLAYLCKARNDVWATPDTLWKDVVSKSPLKTRGYLNLGIIGIKEGRLDDAEKIFRFVLDFNPKSIFSFYKLAYIYKKQGRESEAIEMYKRIIKLGRTSIDAYYQLGNIYLKSKDYPKAEFYYRIGLNIQIRSHAYPDINALYKLGVALFYSGKANEAIKTYKKLLTMYPDNSSVLHNLGLIYGAIGEEVEGKRYLQMAQDKGFKSSPAE